MHARVVRFTGVSPERIDQISSQVEQDERPPEGVDSAGFQLLVDRSQGTATFIALFDTEEKMREAAAVFEAMDPSETPGTRASVDMCEVAIERRM